MTGIKNMYEIKSGRIKPKRESTFGKKKSGKKSDSKKSDLFGHIRLKPKPSMKNEPKITKEDKEYLEWLQTLDVPCFCCGGQNSIEWHHVKRDSSDSKNHTLLIPLCGAKCHRLGTELSAHGTPKKFREVFPIEVQKEAAKKFYAMYKAEML